MRLFSIITILFFLLCVSIFSEQNAYAQMIEPNSQVFVFYRKLISCGVIRDAFYGQHDWTEQEVRAKVSSLSTVESKCSADDVESWKNFILNKIPERKKRVQLDALKEAQFRYSYLPGGDTRYTNNNRGVIDAIANTFREGQQGRLLGVGNQIDLMSQHRFFWGDQSFVLAPRFSLLFSKNLNSYDDALVTLDQGYGLFEFWKLRALVGRSNIPWGQGHDGGMIFSSNARNIDHLYLTHKNPFRLPFFLKHLGQWKWSYVFGNLGPDQFFPWTSFTGFSLSLKPATMIEIGLSHIFEFGGRGSNDLSPTNGLREFFGFVPAFGISNSSGLGSNKLTSVQARLNFPSFMAGQAYFEYFMDDSNVGQFDGWAKHFAHNSSYKLGVLFDCFFESCRDSVRLEFTRNSPIAYRNGEFLSGWSLNQQILGHPAGPDSNRFLVSWNRDWNELWQSRLDLILTWRESNQYVLSADGLHAFVSVDGAEENRKTLQAFLARSLGDFELSFLGGYEFIKNRGFVLGQNLHSGFVQTGVRWTPSRTSHD